MHTRYFTPFAALPDGDLTLYGHWYRRSRGFSSSVTLRSLTFRRMQIPTECQSQEIRTNGWNIKQRELENSYENAEW